MMQEPNAGRRIVSRGEYVRVLLRKIRGWAEALLLFVLAVAPIGLLFGTETRRVFFSHGGTTVLALVYVPLAFCLARKRARLTQFIESVVPFTRANTADLPEPDSLVRASQEPAQQQESVLLRAAAGDTQPLDDTVLLRAARREL